MEGIKSFPSTATEIPALLPIRRYDWETPVVFHRWVTIATSFTTMTLETFIFREDFFPLVNRFLWNTKEKVLPSKWPLLGWPRLGTKFLNNNLFVFSIVKVTPPTRTPSSTSVSVADEYLKRLNNRKMFQKKKSVV